MKPGIRIFLILMICIACIGCDQSTKRIAKGYLPEGEMYSYFNDILRIGYTENRGGFLGIGNELPGELRFWMFVVFVGLLLAGLLVYLFVNSRESTWSLAGMSLVFAGGISNFYDRIVNNGAVVDFLNIGLGSLRTGIFNFADVSIMAGVFIVILISVMGSRTVERCL